MSVPPRTVFTDSTRTVFTEPKKSPKPAVKSMPRAKSAGSSSRPSSPLRLPTDSGGVRAVWAEQIKCLSCRGWRRPSTCKLAPPGVRPPAGIDEINFEQWSNLLSYVLRWERTGTESGGCQWQMFLTEQRTGGEAGTGRGVAKISGLTW